MRAPYNERPKAMTTTELADALRSKKPLPDIVVTVNGCVFGMTEAERQALRNLLADIARGSEEIHLAR